MSDEAGGARVFAHFTEPSFAVFQQETRSNRDYAGIVVEVSGVELEEVD